MRLRKIPIIVNMCPFQTVKLDHRLYGANFARVSASEDKCVKWRDRVTRAYFWKSDKHFKNFFDQAAV